MGWDPKIEGIPKIDGMLSYLQSLDWTEPWLYILVGFYLALFVFLYLTRRYSVVQSFTFILLLLLVYIAEDLNEYFAHNFKLFTKYQYFDSSGLFISLIMSTPLLLASCFIVGNWFHQSTQLLTQVKVMQIKRRAKYEAKQKEVVAETEEDKKSK